MAVTKRGLSYVMGIQSGVTVWKPGEGPKPVTPRGDKKGRPRQLLRRNAKHQPISVKELALSLPAEAWRPVTGRERVKHTLQSRCAGLRVRPARRDYWRSEPYPEGRLLIEWPAGGSEPIKYWRAT